MFLFLGGGRAWRLRQKSELHQTAKRKMDSNSDRV
jgi:hypothetical protein